MKLLNKLLFLLTLMTTVSGITQEQLPQFTQYMYNTISINPAYAGSREALSIVGVYRDQWKGFDRSPKTSTLSVHSPLRDDRIGVGLTFINDALGHRNYNYIYGDFSYTIRTSENIKLAFGLKGGFTHSNFDSDLFNDPEFDYENDPTLVDNARSQWTPNMGVGLYLHTNRWYLGLSAPRIFNNDKSSDEGYVSFDHINYYFTGGYVFDLNEQIKLKPAFMLKGTKGAPLAVDATLNFLFYDKLWLGGAYRFGDGWGAIVDFQVLKQVRIGYAYESPVSDIRVATYGTHEILAIFELTFNNSKMKSPRYF